MSFCDIILYAGEKYDARGKSLFYGCAMNKFFEYIKAMFGKGKSGEDMYASDCLVGVVRDRRQLEINLSQNFYHVPARFVYELDMPIKYVALYTSAAGFGKENAGIHRYGKIASFSAVPRYQIKEIPKNSPEIYFVFKVEKWETLERPVRPLETAQVVTMTSLALIRRSEYMPELYMRTREEFLLFGFLKDICLKGADRRRYNFNGTRIAAAGDVIEIIYRGGERLKVSRKIYSGRPFALYRKIMVKSGHN